MPFNYIKRILNKEIIKEINSEKGSIRLKEDNIDSKIRSVEIHGLHPDTIVFKLDIDKKKFKQKSPYLNETEPRLHSGCDYILVTKTDAGEKVVLFCELKSTEKGAAAQLRNSIPFIEYMASLLKIHHNFNFDDGNFKRHFIVFIRKRLNKERTYHGETSEFYTKKFEGLTINYFKNKQTISLSNILK